MLKKIIFSVILTSVLFTVSVSDKITSTAYAADTIYYYDDYTVNVWNGYVYLPIYVHISVSEEYEATGSGAYITIQTSYMHYDGLVLSDSSYSRTEYFGDGNFKAYSPIYIYDGRDVLYNWMDYNYIKWEPNHYSLIFNSYGHTINTHTIPFIGNYSPNATSYKTTFYYYY
ncbi:MAG: hypothetical protein AB7V16_13520 [Vulcanibacillus sp.]